MSESTANRPRRSSALALRIQACLLGCTAIVHPRALKIKVVPRSAGASSVQKKPLTDAHTILPTDLEALEPSSLGRDGEVDANDASSPSHIVSSRSTSASAASASARVT